MDEGTRDIVGFDIDLMRAICGEIGIKAEYRVVPFVGIISGLNSGKYNSLI
jgi:ABC-type amino acid transport substrate-binding protein